MTILHELDADHEPALANVAHMRQLGRGCQRRASRRDFFRTCARVCFARKISRLARATAHPRGFPGIAVAVKNVFHLVIAAEEGPIDPR